MNTSPFSKNNSELYVIKSFKNLLSAIAICYQKSLLDNISFEKEIDGKSNKLENQIRNRLVDEYLEDPILGEELNLMLYTFTAEAAVIEKGKEKGYIDVKICISPISNINKKDFFVFECKNLDGESALNSEYVKEGIHRFVNEKYPTNLKRNGMLGFIVKTCDIEKNTSKINNLISKSGTNPEIIEVRNNTSITLTKTNILKGFDFSYVSNHQTLDKQKEFELHHLMLDYSQNIV